MNSTSIPGASPTGWEPPSPEELQEMLPQYEITGILGRGGMGAVYKGRQVRLNREVAIKVLPETLTQGGADEMQFAARFELEAQAMAKFSHPSIVSVFDFGETAEGQLYFVMEFVEGMDIHQYLNANGGVLPQDSALSITAHVLDALEYAHSRGIVHRDIKPANILLDTEGQVKIADFGLAKELATGDEDNGPALTVTNMALGTPDFVAPEALDSDGEPDHRADLYAVGVMLYQMLTGKLPRGQFKMPGELVSELDPRLDEIVSRSLQAFPDDRYSSASDMRLAIDPVISAPMSRMEMLEQEQAGSQAIQVVEEKRTKASRVTPSAKKASRNGLYMGVVAAAMLVIAGLLALTKKSGDEKSEDGPSSVVLTEPASSSGGVSSTLASTTKTRPYENHLGMKFVPVPITGGPSDGKTVLFSIWETRVRDYSAFIKENKNHPWPTEVEFPQKHDYPAVNVSWEDAQAFCKWLTEQERKKGNLGKEEQYRLPTDHEWSCAVGIGQEEDTDETPALKSYKLTDVYPWGINWPPPKGSGNYYGEETKQNSYANKIPIEGYNDGFDRTSPVGNFEVNEFGLYDLGGNVQEWCDDWLTEKQEKRVLRGGSWLNYEKDELRSSCRVFGKPTNYTFSRGFRLVVAEAKSPPKPALTTQISTADSAGPKSKASRTTDAPIDLLAAVDVERDAKGDMKWERIAGGLRGTPAKSRAFNGFVSPPVPVSGDYELELRILQDTGKGYLAITFPVGNFYATFMPNYLGGGAIEKIDDLIASFPRNPTRFQPSPIQEGIENTVLLRVCEQTGGNYSIEVIHAGKTLTEWTGDPARLTISPRWNPGTPSRIGLGVGGGGESTYLSAMLYKLDSD